MATSGTGLATGAIGLREVLFQSVTFMAPAGAGALSIAAGATYAGGALPPAVLLALIACLLVATSIGQLASPASPRVPSTRSWPSSASRPPPRWPRRPGTPKRTIQIAVVVSCLVIGLFYVFTTYAGDVFTGPDKFVSFGSLGGGSPWIQLGRHAWGLGWVVVFLAIVNSTFANGNAGTLATTRTWYAMARIGLLPSPLARLHPQWNSPSIGVVVQLVPTLAVGLSIGLHFGPTTAFVFLATILTGIVAFIPAWLTALGIGSSFLKFVTPLSYPASETGLIIGIWFVIGLVVLAYLYARHPERLAEMKKVFADDVPPEPVPSEGAA